MSFPMIWVTSQGYDILSSNNSKMSQDRAMLTIADWQEVIIVNRVVPLTLMTPNPDFKCMPLFDVEYLRNGIELYCR